MCQKIHEPRAVLYLNLCTELSAMYSLICFCPIVPGQVNKENTLAYGHKVLTTINRNQVKKRMQNSELTESKVFEKERKAYLCSPSANYK